MLFYAVFVFRDATLRTTGIREAARGVDFLSIKLYKSLINSVLKKQTLKTQKIFEVGFLGFIGRFFFTANPVIPTFQGSCVLIRCTTIRGSTANLIPTDKDPRHWRTIFQWYRKKQGLCFLCSDF
jgi:hypothetical protein